MQDGQVRFAQVELRTTRSERYPVGGLAALVKRYNLHLQMQECIWVIANDTAGNVRTIVEVARGGHDKVELDIPAAMSAVLASGADCMSIAHNHPTQSALPSVDDARLTNAVVAAANTLGILFEDHVIVEPGGDAFSFREANMIAGATRPKTRAASLTRKGNR